MPGWLTLLVIVILMLALFGDVRRNSAEEVAELAERDRESTPASPGDGFAPAPALRDGSRGARTRSVPARRRGRNVVSSR